MSKQAMTPFSICLLSFARTDRVKGENARPKISNPRGREHPLIMPRGGKTMSNTLIGGRPLQLPWKKQELMTFCKHPAERSKLMTIYMFIRRFKSQIEFGSVYTFLECHHQSAQSAFERHSLDLLHSSPASFPSPPNAVAFEAQNLLRWTSLLK